jgi:hypothetical protein
MAKQSLQDKFQITVPFNPNDDDENRDWVWPTNKTLKPRAIHGGYADGNISEFALGPKGSQHEPMKDPLPYVNMAVAGNDGPTWTDMQEWVWSEHGGAPLVTASDSDVTNSVMQPKHLRDGFTLHDMGNTDDQYTGEGVDQFYGDATGEDDAGNRYSGFVERNNYLDRE